MKVGLTLCPSLPGDFFRGREGNPDQCLPASLVMMWGLGGKVGFTLCPSLLGDLGELRANWTTVSASLSCGALGKVVSLILCPCLPDDLGELRAIWTTVSASLSCGALAKRRV